MRAAAAGLAAGGFQAAGYAYVILDDWYAVRDPATNKIEGDPVTFPSGMAALGAYVHGLGIKYGVYSAASQRTCGNYSASLFLEAQDADTFANDWKIDWLKYDSCFYSNGIASRARYITMRDALNATGRQIFYSMEGQAYFPDVGNMWRTGGDIWPKWDACVLRNLYSNNALASLFVPGAGSFNVRARARRAAPARFSSPAHPRPPSPLATQDPDMLQATGTEGGTSLTFDEARSQFVLWCVMKSPLILGAHAYSLQGMRDAAPDYFALLTHSELIAINQDLSPQATLRLSAPSPLQQAGAINVTLQSCDARRGDQQWAPAPNASGGGAGIAARFGGMCLAAGGAASGGLLAAAPCAGSAAQRFTLPQDSAFHIVQQPATGACLAPGGGAPGALAMQPCVYTGPLPPPFDASIAQDLWVWDRNGAQPIWGGSQARRRAGTPHARPHIAPPSAQASSPTAKRASASRSACPTTAAPGSTPPPMARWITRCGAGR